MWYVAGPNVRCKCDGTGVRARANQMVLWAAIRRRMSSSVGAFSNRVKSLRWLKWFRSVVVLTKKGSCVVQYMSEGLRKDWVILNLVSNLELWGLNKATAPFQLTTTSEQRRRSQPKKTDTLWGRTKRQLPFSWPLPQGDEDGGRRRRQTHSGVTLGSNSDTLWGRTKRQFPFSWRLPQSDEDETWYLTSHATRWLQSAGRM